MSKERDSKIPHSCRCEVCGTTLEAQLAFITREELAELLVVDPSRISHMVEQGIFVKDGDRFPRAGNIKAAFEWMRARIGKSKGAREKHRGLELKNELLASAVAREKREVIPVAEVDKAWADIALKLRGVLLQIPNKLAPQVAYLKDQTAIEAELRREIEEALALLARGMEYGDPSPNLPE